MHTLEEFFVYQNGTDTCDSWSRGLQGAGAPSGGWPAGGVLAWERARRSGRAKWMAFYQREKRGLRLIWPQQRS